MKKKMIVIGILLIAICGLWIGQGKLTSHATVHAATQVSNVVLDEEQADVDANAIMANCYWAYKSTYIGAVGCGGGAELRVYPGSYKGVNSNYVATIDIAGSKKLHIPDTLEWGDTKSKLSLDQGGSIEVRGGNSNLPYIDLTGHTSRDYDARFIVYDKDSKTNLTIQVPNGDICIGSPCGW